MPAHHRPTDVILKPGDYFVGEQPARLRTLLGSCVAITLWHPRRKIGTMSHFLLAQRSSRRRPEVLDARYGDEALALMLSGLQGAGVQPSECEAKIFGGGDMFRALPQDLSGTVGRRNGEAARQMLTAHGIAVNSEHLFGEGHRLIVFDLSDGAVWVKQVVPQQDMHNPLRHEAHTTLHVRPPQTAPRTSIRRPTLEHTP